jgi:hypothetical protein
MMEDQAIASPLWDRDLGLIGQDTVHGIHMESIAGVDGMHRVMEMVFFEAMPMLKEVLLVGIEEHVGMGTIQDLGRGRIGRRLHRRPIVVFGFHHGLEMMAGDRHGEVEAKT